VGKLEFSAWLEEQLRENHLSVKSFAEKAGLARSTVSKILKGQREVTAYTAACIAKGLGVSKALVLEKAGLIEESKKEKLHPLLESALDKVSSLPQDKQRLLAKIIQILAEN
jgi:transcriptional regulator with XRE-family HTH domain